MSATHTEASDAEYQALQRIYLDWHNGKRPLSGFIRALQEHMLQPIPMVNGIDCPACGNPTLILGDGGYVTCSYISCPNPDYEAAIQAHIDAECNRARVEGRAEAVRCHTIIEQEWRNYRGGSTFLEVGLQTIEEALPRLNAPTQPPQEGESKEEE